MRYSLSVIIFSLCVFCPFTIAQTIQTEPQPEPQPQIQTLIFMRHGEKPLLEYGQLNCQGLNRSLKMPKVLEAKFGKPDFIFAPNPFFSIKSTKGFYYYVRALATIEPTAIYQQMPVSAEIPFFLYSAIAQKLLDPEYRKSTIFISWEHFNIPLILKNIMKTLSQDPAIIPSWASKDFDSLYILKINWASFPPKVSFQHDQQELNHLSKSCHVVNPNHELQAKFIQKVIFIPSAERQAGLNDQLSCKGLNRALALPTVLEHKYGRIDLFVAPKAIPKDNEPMHFITSLMTLEPSVIKFGKPFFIIGHDMPTVLSHLNNPAYARMNIALSWPRHDIINLVRKVYAGFGGNPKDIPVEHPEQDGIYEVSIDRSKKGLPTYNETTAHLNGLPDTCEYTF